ncbi:MAG: 16S rRNA (guanine(966)-N(2))-methyltransferase RsmD [Clostridia bacterium]|nr:16S rRNA (guanine(966)-N(2))-methyltransferase RsmD [Clostridia bacterium]
MRIIAGKHRGRQLFTPKDDKTIRPTSDFTREALFNILQRRIVGAKVLDLFAGTGAISCESLSRGALSVVCCDRNGESISLIQKNLSMLGEKAEVLRLDWKDSCRRLQGRRFDVVYLDPPYAMVIDEVLAAIAEYDLLAENGVAVYEHDSHDRGPEHAHFEVADERRYGRIGLTFYQRRTEKGE